MKLKRKLEKPGYGVMFVNKGDKRYYYFRVPEALQPFYSKKLMPLGTDEATAYAKAKELLTDPGTFRGTPTKAETKAARKMLANAQGRSKKKGFATDLTVEWIIGQMRKQSFCCAVTGLPFNLDWREGSGATRNAFAPSLDRLNNSDGYRVGNCRVVLSAVNYAMNEWGLETYLEIAEAAVKNSRRSTAEQARSVNEFCKPKQTADLIQNP